MECTAASKPPEMPTPTCPKGKSRSGRRERTDKQQTLLTKRRRVSPTAIGLKPLFLLAKAVKGAPQNQGAKRESRVPASKLLNLVTGLAGETTLTVSYGIHFWNTA